MIDSRNCQDIQTSFDSFELGLVQLDENELSIVEEHMDGCSECRAWLSDWELVKLKVKELPQMAVPAFVLQGIMSSVTQSQTGLLPVSDWFYPAAGLVALLVALVLFTAADAGELISWVLSFAVLFGINYVMKQTHMIGELA